MRVNECAARHVAKETPPWKMTSALVVALCTLLLLLGWLGTSAVPVHERQFAQLLQAEMISRITVEGEGLEAELHEPVQIGVEGRDTVTDRVCMHYDTELLAEDVADWELRGITVVVRQGAEQRWRELAGFAVLFLLLGIGVWHLWTQIQEDRHGGGGPRRRLRELEDALSAGTITPEEYRSRSEALWAEM